jgi:urea transport system ATP-binding protein
MSILAGRIEARMSLVIAALNQHYGSSHTLKNISFEAPSNACTAVLGRNGSGKTTLMKCIMGVLPATSGKISFAGKDLTNAPPHRRSQAGLGYVPQGREIFSNLTVGENLEIAIAAHGIAEREQVIEEAVATFPVIGEMWKRRGGDLSGGQQQQLSIARAIVTRPSLLILDEPTEGIQPSIVQRIEEVIGQLKQRLSILIVEQYLDFACSIADNYVVLSRGETVSKGSIASMDADEVKKFLSV